MSDRFRLNNFDLIRLFAAVQVAIVHGLNHLEIDGGVVGSMLTLVPGVPVFFFVSGFLISKSYENNSLVSEYSLNRALRIYPALIVCTVLAIGSAFVVGYLPGAVAGVRPCKLALWFASQVTLVQFYNPDFMRQFGSGVLNGSLWTITVELQFYVLVPILYRIVARLTRTRAQWNAVVWALTLVSLVANIATRKLSGACSELLAFKLLEVTFIPWFYMFLVGLMAQRYFDALYGLLRRSAPLLIPAYFATAYLLKRVLGCSSGNAINPVLFLLLAATVFTCAYSAPRLSEKLLRRNDISYGVYIYHIPVINVLVYCGLLAELKYLLLALGATIVMAALSWFVVERPAMKLKRRPLVSVTNPIAVV